MADETTEQRIKQIIKEQNEVLQAQIEKENELAALRGESLKRRSQEREAIKKQVELDDERLKNLQEALKLEKKGRENRLAILEAEIQSLENDLKAEKVGSHRALQLEEEIKQKTKSLKTSRDILKATDEELKNQIEILSVERQREILRDKALEAAENLADATEDLLGSVTGISSAWESLSEQISAITEKFKETFTLQNIGASLILKSIQATKELMFEMDNSLAAFKRATGLNGEYTESIVNVQQEMAALGASTADSAKAISDMAAANTTFVFQNQATQESLMKTAVAMEAGYNAGEEFAGSMAFLQTALGQTAESAEQTSLDIVAAAKAMGAPPRQMLDDFAKLGPELAAWGPNTEKVFLETAAAAKALNMQTSEMLSIAEGFDTFASAADKVGQLNAALGGDYFDTMEMVMATEAERIEMLMDGIEASGKSFETMGRFERKRIAAAAGVTVEQLGKMTNANRDLYTEMQNLQKDATMTYNDLTDAAKENMGIQERLAALQKALAVALKPLIDVLNTVLGYIQEFALEFPVLFKIISIGGAILAFFGASVLALGPPLLSMASSLGLVGKATAATGTAAGASSISVAKFGLIIKSLAKSLTAAAPGMIAFGKAVFMVGAGVAVAALGFSQLVSSFQDLGENTDAMIAALGSITLVMAGMVAVIYALASAVAALGAAGTAGAVGLLAIGAAVLMVGGGIALASMGAAELVRAFGEVAANAGALIITLSSFTLIAYALIPAIFGLAAAIKVLGLAGMAAGPGLLAIGAAALMIGAGISLASVGISSVAEGLKTMASDAWSALGALAALAGTIGILIFSLKALHFFSDVGNVGEALRSFSDVDLAMTSDIEATRVVKDTIVAAKGVTPETATNMEAVTEQIIRLHADTANAGTNTVLETVKEVLVGAQGGGATAAAGAGAATPINVILQVDGREIGRAAMPAVNKKFKASVKSD
jgi:hypothetical protein